MECSHNKHPAKRKDSNYSDKDQLHKLITASRFGMGYQSTVDGYSSYKIDLNEYMVSNKPATFFVKMTANSMEQRGIYRNDLLVVDKSMNVSDKDIVVVCQAEVFLIRQIKLGRTETYLLSDYDKTLMTNEDVVWGVVIGVLRRFKYIH